MKLFPTPSRRNGGRARVFRVIIGLLVVFWGVIAWVGVQVADSVKHNLKRDAERATEHIAGTVRLSLDLAQAIFETIDVTHAQVPDPYTVRLIATPAAKAALDQVDAIMLNTNSQEFALALGTQGSGLPSCAANSGTAQANYDLRPDALLVSLRMTDTWSGGMALCVKVSAQRLQNLFQAGLDENPLQARMLQTTSGAALNSVMTPVSAEPLATSAVGYYPLRVEVRADADAVWRLWRREMVPVLLVSVLLSMVLIGAALRALAFIAALEHTATRDGLTGLFNRRHFYEHAKIEFERSKRDKTPLALMLIDIDFFKKVNDTYGHAVGDEVLRDFATTLQKSCRTTDLVARYGGEEFIVLLSPADEPAARQLAERLRAAVAARPVPTTAGPVPMTLSAGLTIATPGAAESADILAKRADDALYVAKANGRNRVEIAPPVKHL